MAIVDKNLLIVEDDEEWRRIYSRAAKGLGMSAIRVANNLTEAQRLLDEMKFAVAFIDIGLDVDDDRNVDGLRVMEDIRARGDETSMIVVTGRSGRDVLPITRDAIKKWNAFDTVGKVPLEPADIIRLLEDGQRAFKQASSANRASVYQVLRGDVRAWDWDDRILRATRIRGGINRLYGFLDQLFGDYLPIVPRDPEEATRLDSDVPLAYGEYWSRAIGQGVFICFGHEEFTERAVDVDDSVRLVLGRFKVGETLREVSAGAVKGFVFALPAELRTNFYGG